MTLTLDVDAETAYFSLGDDEYESARDEGCNVDYVRHPEIIGRGYRAAELSNLLEQIREDGRAWIPTMEELARHVGPKLRGPQPTKATTDAGRAR